MWPFKKKNDSAPKTEPTSAAEKPVTDIRAAVREVKSRLKALAALQKKGKRARKTTIPAEERAALLAELGLVGRSEWGIAVAVIERRGEITAHLNFLRELRGKEYCHGVREAASYEYASTIDALRREFPIVSPKA